MDFRTHRRFGFVIVAASTISLAFPQLATAAQAPVAGPSIQAAAGPNQPGRLTNTGHLDFLMDSVPLPVLSDHTTYRIDAEPEGGALWTYSDRRADGSYSRVGGGAKDPATGYFEQGAYNADDIARAAVAYIRHWTATGDTHSREHAYQLLRTNTYLQTATGPDAGNVVLWMQSDGQLNPSPVIHELPDPSDSDQSYWLARTVWALGEGYAAFKDDDPDFASFLSDRYRLALSALERAPLSAYPLTENVHDWTVPSWLIAGGADATAEAVFGLAAYLEADPTDDTTRTMLGQFADAIASMSMGGQGQWPYGAIMPWTGSPSLWHGWGGMPPAALVKAGVALGRTDLIDAALADLAQFTPLLLATSGPVNGWTPTPADLTQIAYGVDSRIQGLLAAADATGATGLRELAGVVGAWYFGANPAGTVAYDVATGTAIDGISGSGVVNRNSGAESTIHAVLSMEALDAAPEAAAVATTYTSLDAHQGLQFVEAESGTFDNGSVVVAPSAWTGEANWSGGSYVQLSAGGSLTIPVTPSDSARYVQPIVNQSVAPSGDSTWNAGGAALGITANGGIPQGIAEIDSVLRPLPLTGLLPAGATSVTVTTSGSVSIDALIVQPAMSSIQLSGGSVTHTVLISGSAEDHTSQLDTPLGVMFSSYDAKGQLLETGTAIGPHPGVVVPAGGFVITDSTDAPPATTDPTDVPTSAPSPQTSDPSISPSDTPANSASATGTLAATGTDTTGLLTAAALLIVSAGALLIRRRRKIS